MADTEKNKVWIHLLMEKELAEILDKMVAQEDSDRSKFIRNLIREKGSQRGYYTPSNPKKRTEMTGRVAV